MVQFPSVSAAVVVVGLGSLLLGKAAGYAAPGPCSGVCVNTHDPCIVRRGDGTYYRFSTNGKIAVHSAPSLSGPWTFKGAALPAGSSINLPGNQDLWAPNVIQEGNTYYLYYAVSEFGSQNSAIGVATSTDLDTWTDRGATGVRSSSAKNYNAIDPDLTKVGGQWIMSFGSFWGDIFQVPMKNPPMGVASGAASRQVIFDPATTAIEGSALIQHGSFYYMFFSKGKCCGYDKTRPAAGEEYKIMVCRSLSATGGFVDKNGVDCLRGGGTTVLESHGNVYGPGGQGVFNDPVQGPVLYYHYVNAQVGFQDSQKQFGWNKIDFSSGWPVV